MDVDAFIARYPEFSTTDPAVITAVFAEASRGVDAGVYGLRAWDAAAALAAHRLYISPAGMSLRGESDEVDTSDYLKAFEKICRECAPKFLVL